jgi:hypothetical protein
MLTNVQAAHPKQLWPLTKIPRRYGKRVEWKLCPSQQKFSSDQLDPGTEMPKLASTKAGALSKWLQTTLCPPSCMLDSKPS